ncbi:hypothetical protein NXX78_24365 [Bacteroides fragilis]|nr:hypothetical protein [Bacteroides fragilis]
MMYFAMCETLTRKYPGVHDAMLEIPATDYRVIYFIPQKVLLTLILEP